MNTSNSRILFTVVTLLLVTAIGGCSKLRKSWVKDGYQGKHFTKLAVLGISSDQVEKEDYEAYTVGLLIGEKVKALPGKTVFPKQALDETAVEELIEQNHVDGILAVSLVVAEEQVIQPESYNKFSKFYSHRFLELNTQQYLSSKPVYMEARLYDLQKREGNLVWIGEMALLDQKNTKAKYRFIRKVVNQLIDDNLIRVESDQSSTAI